MLMRCIHLYIINFTMFMLKRYAFGEYIFSINPSSNWYDYSYINYYNRLIVPLILDH